MLAAVGGLRRAGLGSLPAPAASRNGEVRACVHVCAAHAPCACAAQATCACVCSPAAQAGGGTARLPAASGTGPCSAGASPGARPPVPGAHGAAGSAGAAVVGCPCPCPCPWVGSRDSAWPVPALGTAWVGGQRALWGQRGCAVARGTLVEAGAWSWWHSTAAAPVPVGCPPWEVPHSWVFPGPGCPAALSAAVAVWLAAPVAPAPGCGSWTWWQGTGLPTWVPRGVRFSRP